MLLGQYIVKRLEQLGVTHVFGLPGDYNMQLLDHIEDSSQLEWVGCANELNASYAADGYARSTERIAALVTTFGVGELSALNGVAGAFTEKLPVMHIVGAPPSTAQSQHLWMHHTLGNYKYEAYYQMSQHISCDSALIGWSQRDLDNAPDVVDRLIVSMLKNRQPVYLGIPVDKIDAEVSEKNLANPVTVPRTEVPVEKREFVVNQMADNIFSAKCPLFLVDGCVSRHNVTREVYEFLKRTGMPVVVAPMGKSLYPEDDEQFLGVYVGAGSSESLQAIMSNVDLLVSLGSIESDMNTCKFSYTTPMCHRIEIHHQHCQIGYAMLDGIGFHEVLPDLGKRLAAHQSKHLDLAKSLRKELSPYSPEPDLPCITHSYLWHRLGSFLRPHDHLVADMGTSCFGATQTQLPPNTHYYQQILYGSIGWSVGALLGVLCGAKSMGPGRVILFVGDGSLMLTMQEIATIMRYGLTPIIFVLNNDGYEIEREIHGPDRSYNNIPRIDYSLLLDFMGSTRKSCASVHQFESRQAQAEAQKSHAKEHSLPSKHYHAVHTRDELEALFNDPSFQEPQGIHFVELYLRRSDAPVLLSKLTSS